MTRIVTRETPVGELVPSCGGDTMYPSAEIRLKRDDGTDILLGVIEYDMHEDKLRWVRWDNLNEGDADPVVFSLSKKEIERQIAEFNGPPDKK